MGRHFQAPGHGGACSQAQQPGCLHRRGQAPESAYPFGRRSQRKCCKHGCSAACAALPSSLRRWAWQTESALPSHSPCVPTPPSCGGDPFGIIVGAVNRQLFAVFAVPSFPPGATQSMRQPVASSSALPSRAAPVSSMPMAVRPPCCAVPWLPSGRSSASIPKLCVPGHGPLVLSACCSACAAAACMAGVLEGSLPRPALPRPALCIISISATGQMLVLLTQQTVAWHVA